MRKIWERINYPPHIERKQELDQRRAEEMEKGFEVDFGNGQLDVLQTRPQDQINLLAINSKATAALGQVDATIKIRAASDVTYQLTPEKAVEVSQAALTYIEHIYQTSWDLKDEIDALVSALPEEHSLDDIRDAIAGVVWPEPETTEEASA